jgi:hypothetical protein
LFRIKLQLQPAAIAFGLPGNSFPDKVGIPDLLQTQFNGPWDPD